MLANKSAVRVAGPNNSSHSTSRSWVFRSSLPTSFVPEFPHFRTSAGAAVSNGSDATRDKAHGMQAEVADREDQDPC